MKRALRWIGAAILGLSVLVMVLADVVLAATLAEAQEPAPRVTLLQRGPVHGLVAGGDGAMTPAVVGEAAPVLLVPGTAGVAGRRAAIARLNGFCAGRGLDVTPAAAWDDDYIHFDAGTGSYQFPNPCGLGL